MLVSQFWKYSCGSLRGRYSILAASLEFPKELEDLSTIESPKDITELGKEATSKIRGAGKAFASSIQKMAEQNIEYPDAPFGSLYLFPERVLRYAVDGLLNRLEATDEAIPSILRAALDQSETVCHIERMVTWSTEKFDTGQKDEFSRRGVGLPDQYVTILACSLYLVLIA